MDFSKIIRKKAVSDVETFASLDNVLNVVDSELSKFVYLLPNVLKDSLTPSEVAALYIYNEHKNDEKYVCNSNCKTVKSSSSDYKSSEECVCKLSSKTIGVFSHVDTVLRWSEDRTLKKFCSCYTFYVGSINYLEMCFALAVIKHRSISRGGVEKASHSIDSPYRIRLVEETGILQNNVIILFFDKLYGISVEEVIDDVFLELELFFRVLNNSLKDVIEYRSFEEVLKVYGGIIGEKLNDNRPDSELIERWLLTDVNNWQEQAANELSEYYPGVPTLHAAYARLVKNNRGNYDECGLSQEEADKFWKLGGEPELQRRGWIDPVRMRIVAISELYKFYQSLGYILDDAPDMVSDEDLLLYYALWIGKGYVFDKVDGRYSVHESIK